MNAQPAIRFDGGDLTGKNILAAIATFLSGAGGMKLLERMGSRWHRGDSNSKEITVKVIDDGATMRHELLEEARLLRAVLATETQRRHLAEMDCAELKGKNSELERRLGRLDQQLADALKMRQALADTQEGANNGTGT